MIEMNSMENHTDNFSAPIQIDEAGDADAAANENRPPPANHRPRRRGYSTPTARHLHLSPHFRESPVDESPEEQVDRTPVLQPISDEFTTAQEELHRTESQRADQSYQNNPEETHGIGNACCSWESNRMRWKIKFFFMDPVKKWRTKRQFPWKLFLQVIKIFFVTFQLVILGTERYRFANFLKHNTVSFRHLLLKDWIDSDVPPVYPNTGLYCVYTQDDFHEYADFAINNFMRIRDKAIGTYHFMETKQGNQTIAPFRFCKREFIDAHIFPQNHSFIYDSGINETCYQINIYDFKAKTFKLKTYLGSVNGTINFDRLVDARLEFEAKSVALKPDEPDDEPTCYVFDVKVLFDNRGHYGQIPIDLDLVPHAVPCNGKILFVDTDSAFDIVVIVLDVCVLLICMVSLVLCLRALYKAELLKSATIIFFRRQYGYELTKTETVHFLNLWYVMIVVNDILIICGTIIKLKINAATITDMPLYNSCGMLLGVGNLLVWFGVLRYLGFFKTYNILILTFKRAIPDVARYLVCTMLIFCGFAFCGWIVLGPYHVKFQTFHSTTETIFSLINGDDMFATFAMLPYNSNTAIFIFSRLYLYAFICVFTYVILSLMISLIMDAYGTVKDFYMEGGGTTRLQRFMNEPTVIDFHQCSVHEHQSSFSSFHSEPDDFLGRCCGFVNWFRKRRGLSVRNGYANESSSSNSFIPHQRLHD